MSARKDNGGLTPEAFGKFLRWLSSDDEIAVREYLTIRKKLVRYFIHKGCADPDVLFDEVVDRVVKKIETGAEYSNPAAFCQGVARNVWHEYTRKVQPVPLEVDPPARSPIEIHDREQKLQCLDGCMTRLSLEDRDVITRYHEGEGHDKIETRKRLADGLGGVNALRIRMCRIRKDLRSCVVACVKRSVN